MNRQPGHEALCLGTRLRVGQANVVEVHDRTRRNPGEHVRASLEESLAASGLEAFDVLQLHVWSDAWVGRGDWLETVADEGGYLDFEINRQARVPAESSSCP